MSETTRPAITAPALVRRAETTPGTEASRPWAIRIENLGKEYKRHGAGPRAARQSLAETIMGALGRSRIPEEAVGPSETFWALKDINLEVARGEAIGIIGRNGAGKSTLLKILSRITAPTTGTIRYRGTTACLLEVGTGFHPELTGIENIFLNGAILGMKRAEVSSLTHEIVEFSGVRDFIHMPVKHYSSGMKVRLAFSVAAHLRSDILILDEVLSVGDAEFRKKSLAKMTAIARSGRTVLFVSHSMSQIRTLCDRCLLLNEGRTEVCGETDRVISRYEPAPKTNVCQTECRVSSDPEIPFQILEAHLENRSSELSSRFEIDEPVKVVIEYELREPVQNSAFTLEISREGEMLATNFDTDVCRDKARQRPVGRRRVCAVIPPFCLKPGNYSITLHTGIPTTKRFQIMENALGFVISADGVDLTGKGFARKYAGMAILPILWSDPRPAPSGDGLEEDEVRIDD